MNNFIIYNLLTTMQVGRTYKSHKAAKKALSQCSNQQSYAVASELYYIDHIRCK